MFNTKYPTKILAWLVLVIMFVGQLRSQSVYAASTIRYVKADATGANDGTSWANAYPNLQSALAVASGGDEIWVAVGTYKPTASLDQTISFELKNGVAIYGGFTGTETLRTQRDPSINVTVLSGDVDNNDINTDGNNIAEFAADVQGANSEHVVNSGFGLTSATILDGFVITAGQALFSQGGGVRNVSSPTFVNLVFSGNSALEGGGMANLDGSPSMTNITFTRNRATNHGGGVFIVAGSPSLTNATFFRNIAPNGMGGGVYNEAGAPVLINVTFNGNAALGGGGIANNGAATFQNVTVSANTASYGGGMLNWGGSPSLTNVTFNRNTGSVSGGGLNNDAGTPILTNVLIANSTGIGNIDCEGGSVDSSSSNNLIENGSCGLTDGSNGNILGQDAQVVILQNNGGFTQTHALLADSPAIDAGNDVNCPDTDQRGVARPQGSHCDIGAYEFMPVIYVKAGASGANNGSSWANAYTDLQSALSAASSGDEIWVAAGTYKPTSETDRTISFVLKNGVAVYGGFVGTELLREEREVESNITVLSGDIGIADEINDNSYHVVNGSGTDATAVLDGFTITKGNVNDLPDPYLGDPWGGGMYILAGSPTLSNLIFTANTARAGGGIALDNSDSVLSNITFWGNSANGGGGMLVVAGVPRLKKLTFNGNTANGVGGGMAISNSNPILENVTFHDNVASMGAGMHTYGSPVLRNVTFSENIAGTGGGGIYNESSNPIIINSIFWNNVGGEIANYDENMPIVSYSIVQGGYAGTGNLDVDPLLEPLSNNGGLTQTLALGAGSPAIDAGEDADCPSTDQRGVTRPQGSHCDIGAYEIEQEEAISFSSAVEDGWILESSETGSVGGTLNKNATTLRVGDDAANRQYRSLLSFDTSSLPAGAVITSVTLRFKDAGKTGTLPFGATHGNLFADMCEGAFKNNSALQLGDFNVRCPVGFYKGKALIYASTSKVGEWYTQALLPENFQFINLAGATQFRLRFARDDNNDFGADFLKLFSGNAAEADRPQLVIEYYVP